MVYIWPFGRKTPKKEDKSPRAEGHRAGPHKVEYKHAFLNRKSDLFECKHCKNKTRTYGAASAHYHYHHSPGHAEKLARKKKYNREYHPRKHAQERQESAVWARYMNGSATEEEKALIDAKIKIEAVKWLGTFFK
jgi:hypothetical protein